ncbi:MAG: hypothetical protein H0X17_01865 [Deltaproteobacteria bacterium]|nr:hypothetical protein [Deltaproteobacteria bacterium]
MKLVTTLAAVLLAATGCEKNPSKLDGAPPVPRTGAGAVAGTGGGGDLEARVAKLEKYNEALEFLQKVFEQQKGQAEQQERSEPAPDAVFAVDIKDSLRLGHVEGPNTAMITIIEAWDFA